MSINEINLLLHKNTILPTDIIYTIMGFNNHSCHSCEAKYANNLLIFEDNRRSIAMDLNIDMYEFYCDSCYNSCCNDIDIFEYVEDKEESIFEWEGDNEEGESSIFDISWEENTYKNSNEYKYRFVDDKLMKELQNQLPIWDR